MHEYISYRLKNLKGSGTVVLTVARDTVTQDKTIDDLSPEALAFAWFPAGATVKETARSLFPNAKEVIFTR